ncbi:hypothetical protein NIES25_52160 [Nostoc linckia NIES-25]|nr:hypothetical protein NIES25_52160 [Nostoc linckia NIES-25]
MTFYRLHKVVERVEVKQISKPECRMVKPLTSNTFKHFTLVKCQLRSL